MRIRSLFLKIFVWFWLAATVIIGVLTLAVWISESETLPERTTRGAFGEALSLYSDAAVQTYETGGVAALNEFVRRSRNESGTDIYLFDDTGKAITATSLSDTVTSIVHDILEPQPSQPPPQRVVRVLLGRVLWGRPMTGPSGRHYIFVVRFRSQPGGPRPPLFSTSRIAIIILTAGVVCYLLALYLTSPVKKLKETVQAFAQGNLDVRVTPKLGSRRDELADLGREFDMMAERIAALISSQKRLLADISHELRSPLARLSVALELARKNSNGSANTALDRIEQEAERVNKLVGQLLALTRLESGAEKIPPETVSLEDLVQQVVDDANFEARPLHKEVNTVAMERCKVRGSAELLRSAVENVVRNAIRYTREGTAVEVALRWRLDRAVLTVHDNGPGVPEPELAHIFEPFYRVSEARERTSGGAGLGLSIAERTVKLHGGSIRAENDKAGLVVTIELPLAPTPSAPQPSMEKVQV